MNKEELIKLGLTEDQATQAASAFAESIKGKYIPRERLNEVTEQVKTLQAQLTERDTAVNDLQDKLKVGGNALEELEKLKANFESKTAEYEAKITAERLERRLQEEITKAGGTHIKAIKGLLNINELSIAEDGSIKGLDIESIKKEVPVLFEQHEQVDTGTGTTQTKPTPGTTITQDMFDNKKRDPEWVDKNWTEIETAMANGEIK